ncbi:MAG: T9SS type A sorting domain-containing protein [Polaribacter sp.]
MKLRTALSYVLMLSLVAFISCSKSEKEIKIEKVPYKKAKKTDGKRHKKGIEYMAEYFKQISAESFDSEKSSYQPGYVLKEFKKAQLRAKGAVRSKNSPSAVFTERGPNNVPGRTRGMAVDPTDNKRWFVGSVGGGVWLTEDEGNTWTNLTDGKIPNLGTSVIVISPQDPNTIFVGTGEPFGNIDAIGGSGIFKTTDGGNNWTVLEGTADFGDVGRMIIDPNNKDIVLAGTQTGIYKTTDGGTTWIRKHDAGNWVQDLDADPSDFNIQYGSVRNFGIVKSIDAGETWTTVFDRADFNENHSRFELSISPADPNYVFLSVYSGSGGTSVNSDFYRSTDKGGTFVNIPPVLAGSSSNLITGQGWYDNIIMAHPFDTKVFYVGGVAVFKVTIDDNDKFSFTSIASGYDNSQINTGVHVDQHGMQYILGTGQEFRILLANDGGVYSTSFKEDPGTAQGDWSNDNLTKNSTQFYGASKQNGQDNYIAGAQDNGSWISQGNDSDASKSYQGISGGDGFEVLWHYNEPGNFISTIQFNRIVRYINNAGALSDFATSGDNSTSPFYSKVSNADNNPDVVFAVDRGGVWRSDDFAGNWTQVPIIDRFAPGATSALNVEVSVANPNVVWAGSAMTESGSFVLHYSTDNGKTFNDAAIYDNPNDDHNLFISGIGVSPTEEKRAYALFSSGNRPKVLKTEDMGATWTDISGFESGANSGFPDVKVHCLIEMPYNKDVIWVGTDIGLVETTDGGQSWSLRNDFISVAIYEMKIVNNQVVFATHGRGVWSAKIAELEGYTLPAYLTEPNVTVRQKGIDSKRAVITYTSTSNQPTRAKIFVDGEENSEVTQTFEADIEYEFETEELSEGKHTFGVQFFNDLVSQETGTREVEFEIVEFGTPSNRLAVAQFSDLNSYRFDSSFKIDDAGGLTDVVINTADNPYQDNRTYSFVLRRPLILTNSNNQLNFTDVAIVEPFDNPLSDLNQFYDYVIIEASSDLKTWITLDKYDARRFSDWLDAYNDNTSVFTDGLFKQQSVNLTNKGLQVGETYVFKFSLKTDSNTNSLGWAVKSVNATTASIQEVLNNERPFSVFPTISNGNFTIFGNYNLGKSKVQLVDMTGREVYKNTLDFSSQNEYQISTNTKPGVYILNIVDESNKRKSEKLIIK